MLYYKCHKTNFKLGGSYTEFLDLMKNKNEIRNLKNKDDKCFQHVVMVALNYRVIESHPERVSNIKPIINKYNWNGIKYPSKIDDWKTFEKNNPTIDLNVLYIKDMEICPAHISKINLNFEKQIIFLMILIEEKEDWNYLAVKCLFSFRTENKLKSHEKVCKICNAIRER